MRTPALPSPPVPQLGSHRAHVNRAAGGAPRVPPLQLFDSIFNPSAPPFSKPATRQRDIDDLIQFSRAGAARRFDRHAAHDGDQVARQGRGLGAWRQIIFAKRALQPLLDGLAQTVAAIASLLPRRTAGVGADQCALNH